jgi:Rha family phage regulatory protein
MNLENQSSKEPSFGRLPIDAQTAPVIHAKDGEAFADSRDVAAFFEKRHDHVIRDIRALIAKEPSLGLPIFGEFKIRDLTGDSTSHFEMNRKGFVLLAMGFTGERALKWKLAYIDAFDVMEAELRNRPLIDPMKALNDPAALRGLLLNYSEKVSALEGRVTEMQPKVEALERIADSHGTFNRTTAAKMLSVSPHALIRWMRTNHWTYRRPGTPEDIGYQSKIEAGLLEHKINTGPRDDGTEWSSTQVRVTPKGLTVLAKAFPPTVRSA